MHSVPPIHSPLIALPSSSPHSHYHQPNQATQSQSMGINMRLLRQEVEDGVRYNNAALADRDENGTGARDSYIAPTVPPAPYPGNAKATSPYIHISRRGTITINGYTEVDATPGPISSVSEYDRRQASISEYSAIDQRYARRRVDHLAQDNKVGRRALRDASREFIAHGSGDLHSYRFDLT